MIQVAARCRFMLSFSLRITPKYLGGAKDEENIHNGIHICISTNLNKIASEVILDWLHSKYLKYFQTCSLDVGK